MSEEMKHSPIGASSATRWMHCPGSVRMNKDKKSTSSRFASEGTAAHTLCEMCLRSGNDPFFYINTKIIADDIEFIVDEEMVDAVQMYVDTINADISEGTELLVENGFKLEHLHPMLWGTNDACVFQEFGVLRVYDFKYGKGIAVDAKDNSQLKYYAIGALDSMCDCVAVELVIIQPRARHADGPIRRWMTTPDEIVHFGIELKEAALETENPDAALHHGDWCGFCPSLGSCPAVKKKNMEVAKLDFAPLTNDDFAPVKELDNEDISAIMRAEDLFKKWLKAVAAEAMNRANSGQEIPRCKLVRSVTRRKWVDEKVVGRKLHELLGEDAYVNKLITLTQAEKKMKGRFEDPAEAAEALRPLWEKPKGGTILVPEEDKRAAVLPSAQSDFDEL